MGMNRVGVEVEAAVVLVLVLVVGYWSTAADSKLVGERGWGWGWGWGLGHLSSVSRASEELVGNQKDETMMESQSSSEHGMYISYDALKADNVPCNRQGYSYYNCNQQGEANPYSRGCSYITRCTRYTE